LREKSQRRIEQKNTLFQKTFFQCDNTHFVMFFFFPLTFFILRKLLFCFKTNQPLRSTCFFGQRCAKRTVAIAGIVKVGSLPTNSSVPLDRPSARGHLPRFHSVLLAIGGTEQDEVPLGFRAPAVLNNVLLLGDQWNEFLLAGLDNGTSSFLETALGAWGRAAGADALTNLIVPLSAVRRAQFDTLVLKKLNGKSEVLRTVNHEMFVFQRHGMMVSCVLG